MGTPIKWERHCIRYPKTPGWVRITRMIILMLRMIRMIILMLRMIILMGQDDGSWFMAHGSRLMAHGSWPRGASTALEPAGAPGPVLIILSLRMIILVILTHLG